MLVTSKRTYNLRQIKRDISYSVPEIANHLNVSVGTVRRWMKEGLRKIDCKRPYLINGASLIRFLGKRQKKRKCKCRPDEFYCLKCRAPRKANQKTISFKVLNDKKMLIKGICMACGTIVNRAGTVEKRKEYEQVFGVKVRGAKRIRYRTSPLCNDHFKGKKESKGNQHG